MATAEKTTESTATEKESSDAKAVEKDHKAGKGLKSGWSYSPTRDPKYMTAKDAEQRRAKIIATNSGPGGSTAVEYADAPQHAKKA